MLERIGHVVPKAIPRRQGHFTSFRRQKGWPFIIWKETQIHLWLPRVLVLTWFMRKLPLGTSVPKWNWWSRWYTNTDWLCKATCAFQGLGKPPARKYHCFMLFIYIAMPFNIMSVEDGIVHSVVCQRHVPNGTLLSNVSIEVSHLHLCFQVHFQCAKPCEIISWN